MITSATLFIAASTPLWLPLGRLAVELGRRPALSITEPLEENDAPKAGDIYAFGIRGYEVIDLIITDIQPGRDLSAVLTCVEYSPEIFGVDDQDCILPEFENKITPVSGAVDSGVVNPNRWRLFAVYHDGEAEPPRPSGEGQGDGWHHMQTFRSVWQSTKMAESAEAGEWGLPVRIKAERGTDDITPVWLSLSPQHITLETDGDGTILAGLLPLAVQARLFRWNSVLPDTVFSLAGAPAGISVNPLNGLITVGANADLAENNSVTVNAMYQGTAYTAALIINKNIRSSPARYLGTITTLPSNAAVTIVQGPVTGQVPARQGDFVLAVAAVGGRPAGSVFQWTGVTWQFRSADTHSDLYIRCFKDGLDIAGLAGNTEWFGAVIARQIVALRAFIETLEAQILKISGVIYGGNRFNADGNVVNPNADGWHLGSDGILKAFRGIFNDIVLTASSFEITANNRGYLPIGFIYFQLRGQPEPKELFSGTWENISPQFAGLFFRVEGGNAASFGQNQAQSIQSHSHSFFGSDSTGDYTRVSTTVTGSDWAWVANRPQQRSTGNTGSTETIPANTTIRVWKRIN